MTTRLAIFDCDGTLIDGQASICEAMEEAFAAQSLAPPERNHVRRVVGLSLPVAVLRLAPNAEPEIHDALVESYKLAFRTARSEGRLSQPLIPGILEVLESLQGAGWLLGVATGMSDRGLTHCLASHGITDKFVTLQTADGHPSKPDPSMVNTALFDAAADAGNAVMIGDTVFDIEMAGNAGIRGIGVDWGYHTPQDLVAAGAEFVAETPAQLTEYLLA
ncbi:MAG: HAD-IA family hydrolase [Sphingomonadaceae bacterium]|nr:HAD-IA family hydrolase [Sphingomonadaceae bacterium]